MTPIELWALIILGASALLLIFMCLVLAGGAAIGGYESSRDNQRYLESFRTEQRRARYRNQGDTAR